MRSKSWLRATFGRFGSFCSNGRHRSTSVWSEIRPKLNQMKRQKVVKNDIQCNALEVFRKNLAFIVFQFWESCVRWKALFNWSLLLAFISNTLEFEIKYILFRAKSHYFMIRRNLWKQIIFRCFSPKIIHLKYRSIEWKSSRVKGHHWVPDDFLLTTCAAISIESSTVLVLSSACLRRVLLHSLSNINKFLGRFELLMDSCLTKKFWQWIIRYNSLKRSVYSIHYVRRNTGNARNKPFRTI